MEGSLSRSSDPEAGAYAEGCRGCEGVLLTGLLCLLLIEPGTTLPAVDWSPPTSITNFKKCSTGLPAAWSFGGIFSIKLPSSPLTLACVKVT